MWLKRWAITLLIILEKRWGLRKFVLMSKFFYLQNKDFVDSLTSELANEKSEKKIKFIYLTVKFNELKFGSHVCINKLHHCAKLKFFSSNCLLMKKIAKSPIFREILLLSLENFLTLRHCYVSRAVRFQLTVFSFMPLQ